MTGEERKVILASSLGTVFEWYDFIIYGFFATSISETFFPAQDERVALLATFAAFGVGYILRPLGAIVIGLIGDWKGRKTALLLSTALMGAGTIVTGVLPSYQVLGILAPCLLVVARLIQGFAVGGNLGSSATYLVETAPEKKRGLYGSFQQVTQVAGLVLGYLAWKTKSIWGGVCVHCAVAISMDLLALAHGSTPGEARRGHRTSARPQGENARGTCATFLVGTAP